MLVISTQHDQMPQISAAHTVQLPCTNAVHTNGYGTHIVLIEHQQEQAGEALRIRFRIPQNTVILLQGSHGGFPQLFAFLCLLGIARRFQSIGTGSQQAVHP